MNHTEHAEDKTPTLTASKIDWDSIVKMLLNSTPKELKNTQQDLRQCGNNLEQPFMVRRTCIALANAIKAIER
jgi:hypothetical protein